MDFDVRDNFHAILRVMACLRGGGRGRDSSNFRVHHRQSERKQMASGQSRLFQFWKCAKQ